MQIFGDKACHPERSEGSLRPSSQILRCAQDDRQDTSQARSREVFSPNVYNQWPLLDYAGQIKKNGQTGQTNASGLGGNSLFSKPRIACSSSL
jgi:hypothetical protein